MTGCAFGVPSTDASSFSFVNVDWRLIGDLSLSGFGVACASVVCSGDAAVVWPGDFYAGDSGSFGYGCLVFSGLPGFREAFRGIDGLSSTSAAFCFVYRGGGPLAG